MLWVVDGGNEWRQPQTPLRFCMHAGVLESKNVGEPKCARRLDTASERFGAHRIPRHSSAFLGNEWRQPQTPLRLCVLDFWNLRMEVSLSMRDV
jgi:hypothetical protein